MGQDAGGRQDEIYTDGIRRQTPGRITQIS